MAILKAQTERMMAEEDLESLDVTLSDEATLPQDNGHHTVDAEHDDHADAPQPAGQEMDLEPPEHLDGGDSPTAHPDESIDAHLEEADNEPPREAAAAAELFELMFTDEPAVATTQDEEVSQPAPPPAPGDTESMGEPETVSVGTPEQAGVVQPESTGAPVSWRRHEQPSRHGDRPRPPRRRQYKIQEVIKRRQVMLIQVVKEERGNKGASLTTFLSLAGRYCVLMPNTPRGGGISRKITNAADRKRLKAAAQSLELPEGMGLIIRTAGANRTKVEIRRDYEYLLRLWDTVRELTLKSNAPALVYEEGSLIKRAIRDLYSKEISEVLVDGESGYREAKEFMRMLMPSHAKNVKLYREPLPLFQKLQVEAQLDAMFSPIITLKSGGYVVINQTEALVAIDVNSGRATREHSIEETALKTNLEAADEIGRQLRLRDLAGLIVIDFIDMEDPKNDRTVEKRLHNAVRNDRARIQIGRISQFGLLELSRQRLRAGVVAGSTITCPHCNGQGIIRSTESAALRLLRALDEEGQRQPSVNLTVRMPPEVAIYALNQKRREVARIEEAYDVAILFEPQPNMVSGSFEIQRTGMRVPAPRPKLTAVSVEGGFQEPDAEPEADVTIVEPPETAPAPFSEAAAEQEAAGAGAGRKRRRRRRGGRGRTGRPDSTPAVPEISPVEQDAEIHATPALEAEPGSGGDGQEGEIESLSGQRPAATTAADAEKRRRRRRRGRRGRRFEPEISTPAGEPDAEKNHANSIAAADVEGHPPPPDSAAPPVAFQQPRPAMEAPAAVNTPSSPVWTLLDQQTVEDGPTPPAEAEPLKPLEKTPAVETAAEVVQEMSPAGTAPQEARRGWWQRRFRG